MLRQRPAGPAPAATPRLAAAPGGALPKRAAPPLTEPSPVVPARAVARLAEPSPVIPASAPAVAALGLPAGTLQAGGAPGGTLKAYGLAKISMFDDKGRWLRQVPASALPAVPAGGVPFHEGPKSLLVVTLGGRQFLLDRTELTIEQASRVYETCEDQRQKGTTMRAGNYAMGHGNCRR